ncbi:hypothetical protein MNBD_NITROSPINAE04-2603 [hydrothermal vent metagenome]|uniref:Uncharacterized protein n=1 Tax=hydrothermal vent metagenome TaxID=652676 RepID=A0A3B1BD61_9ZZZZ
MSENNPIPTFKGINDRPVLRDWDDIRREIEKTPKPDIMADRSIELGPCGMGMTVIQSNWAIKEMKPGEVLRTESSHP